ncbi:bifunctional phosphopantothenoylcysteine decarboxylase/phosphopantothenate--cysteine ligase CoaBC [Pelagicoccus sp. SDUM812005]|uniref:bifunctional phosphopantothenoylcysteine decarboxylase/phosphopantothenate--cysteine ligase CoaBC n=1 Tax=Pelagicoccus sp. SDUM812005 TaxID=3041257 RepID=UPI00280D13EC|nr:bifunctional phosphopantothenoylcysteine decarboxylase/phosphopantothenate--cysteine ligase CoaBC [Pelagicoccus sp. SDUM812005]MDQ8181753.1 bifunctional phosphopantothenoylcysteine decarboxylase/phosphopantothenate--cysteine ligase CoaBC [Pelagicoccus sp. SDUM812005]
MASLSGKRITLIITGSIAAYKALELIRLLAKAGASVEGVLTQGGAAFITPLSVEALTGKPAHTAMWDERSYEMNHIELSRRADLIVIAPATAGIIAKLANGIGDDLASSVLLAKNKPVLLAPSMNTEMWENAAFRRNLAQAQADGATLVPPQTDTLACGETGIGKMAEPATILAAIEAHFQAAETLSGKTAIVTSGGTIERIDSVRYISNFSSGKQGNAIALALAQAGAKVSLVVGNTKEPAPQHPNIEALPVESAAEMKAAVEAKLPADIFVGCAAVCDFRVSNKADKKLKKEGGLDLQFEENPDIAKSVGTLPKEKRPQLVIGFAAETDDLIAYAQKKRASKGCDLIVANDVSQGAVFGQDQNTVHFVTKDSVQTLDTLPKSQVAAAILNWIRERL